MTTWEDWEKGEIEANEKADKEDRIVRDFLDAEPVEQMRFWDENDEECAYKIISFLVDQYPQILPLLATNFYYSRNFAKETIIEQWEG